MQAYEQGTYFIFDLLGNESIAAANRIRVEQTKSEPATEASNEAPTVAKKSEFEIDFSQLINTDAQTSQSLFTSDNSALSGIKSTSSFGNTVSSAQQSAFQLP